MATTACINGLNSVRNQISRQIQSENLLNPVPIDRSSQMHPNSYHLQRNQKHIHIDTSCSIWSVCCFVHNIIYWSITFIRKIKTFFKKKMVKVRSQLYVVFSTPNKFRCAFDHQCTRGAYKINNNNIIHI